jgi:glutamate racemase
MSLLVFDSGIGGLGVVAEIRRAAPGLAMDYLADNGFYPYGEKPNDVLIARILEVVGASVRVRRPDVVVVACNTASTIALGALRAAFEIPIVGCVPPVKPAAAASVSRQIGLLATAATIRRPYLQDLVERFGGGCVVHSLGTPVLADLAEAKFRGGVVDMAALAKAVAPMFEAGPDIDAVALGCTHYTFLREEFAALRPDLAWFDPAEAVARQAVRVAGEAGATAAHHTANRIATRTKKSTRRRIEDLGFSAFERLGVPGA